MSSGNPAVKPRGNCIRLIFYDYHQKTLHAKNEQALHAELLWAFLGEASFLENESCLQELLVEFLAAALSFLVPVVEIDSHGRALLVVETLAAALSSRVVFRSDDSAHFLEIDFHGQEPVVETLVVELSSQALDSYFHESHF